MDGIEKEVLDSLVAKSVEVKGKAYAPYSSFPVGAALLTETGHIFTGKSLETLGHTQVTLPSVLAKG